jgi:hypothetical protein
VINRTYTYIVFGVGVLLCVAGAVKVLPGGLSAGASAVFLGLVMFGLSFIPRSAAAEDAASPPMGDAQRLTGIFFEPSNAFRSLRPRPSWLLPVLIIAVLGFAYSTAFTMRLTPERIIGFTTDKLVEKGWVPADKAEEAKADQVAQAKSPVRVALGVINAFLATFMFVAILGALYMLGVLLFGGRIGFWQALGTAAWAALPPTLITRVLSLVLLYVKDPDDIHPILGANGLVTDNLGALVKPADSPVLFAVLSAFGLLALYHVWLTATGLRNAGQRVSSSAAWSVAIGIWVIGLLLAVVSSALFGNFLS